MRPRSPWPAAAPALSAILLLSAFQAPQKPEDQFVGFITTYLAMGLPTDWDGLAKLPLIKWAPQVTSLQNCLPDGGCYTLQGTAVIGESRMTVIATGARTMALTIYFRNTTKPLGEAAVLAALKGAGLTADLARCPAKAGVIGTNWYRLKGDNLSPAFLSIQPPTQARPTEGFVLSQGEKLPPLQPNQVANYSEECAAGADRKPVSTLKPHELIAETVVALLLPATGPAAYTWEALAAVPNKIEWLTGPMKMDLTYKSDPNPMARTGSAEFAGRSFGVLASGTETQAKTIYLDEPGQHPRGEHMLGVVYQKGITVQLVRCGPVYSSSTHMWYSLTSPKTRPAMIRQSISYDGNQVSDSYELRLDGTLPTRDPRDRNPGVNGC